MHLQVLFSVTLMESSLISERANVRTCPFKREITRIPKVVLLNEPDLLGKQELVANDLSMSNEIIDSVQ